MLWRDRFEGEYSHLFASTGYGTTIWSPLCQGLLCGKYNSGNAPEASRFAGSEGGMNPWGRYMVGEKKEATVKILCKLGELAKELGCT